MEKSALWAIPDPTHPPRPADLDLVGVAPTVIEVGSFPRHGYVSPLDRSWGVRHSLYGGVVTDPGEIDAIRARVAYYARPWYVRLFVRRPR